MKVPTREAYSDKTLERLTSSYRKAVAQIDATFEGATDFGQARRTEMLVNIEKILSGLGQETGDWIKATVPELYQRGTNDAISQLTALKVPRSDSATMSVIDRRAVAALVDDQAKAFAESLTTTARSSRRALNTAAKTMIEEELVQGRILGETRKQVTARIKGQIKAQGVAGLVDKGGRSWTLDRYATMLARTKMTESRNTGLANKMLANGYDLVEVSNHSSKHIACANYEGKVLSITGKSKDHPSVAEATSNGLFHPNCKHTINAVHSKLADRTTAYNAKTGKYETPAQRKKAAAAAKKPKATPKATPKPKASTGGRSVAISNRNGEATYKLSAREAKFAKDTGLEMTGQLDPFTSRWSKNTNGYYMPRRHSLHIRNPGTKTAEHTFYHELGHALDHKIVDGTPLRKIPAVAAAARTDGKAVITARLQRQFAGRGVAPYKDEEVWRLMRGGSLKVKGGSVILPKKHIKYLAGHDEVIGDAYAQYKLNNKAFQKYAPELTKVFKEYIE